MLKEMYRNTKKYVHARKLKSELSSSCGTCVKDAEIHYTRASTSPSFHTHTSSQDDLYSLCAACLKHCSP